MRTMYDAAYPPPDPHLDVCGGYIGGDTPHVWSDAEWAGQSARWRLPIYTCDNPAQRDPMRDSTEAIAWLRAHHVPAGCAVALDYEAAVDSAYVTTFDRQVTSAGWTVLLYGSLSTVMRNPKPSAGYWTAYWTRVPHLDAGAAATQYASDTQLGRPYDLSLVSDSLRLWDTHQPAPAPAPAQSHDPEDDMLILREQGANSVYGLSGGVLWGIAEPASLQAYINAGIQQVTVTPAEIARIQAGHGSTAVTVDASQLSSALVAALSDAGLLARLGAAIAHAEAVQQHAETPAS